jgi:hypothetical protein
LTEVPWLLMFKPRASSHMKASTIGFMPLHL